MRKSKKKIKIDGEKYKKMLVDYKIVEEHTEHEKQYVLTQKFKVDVIDAIRNRLGDRFDLYDANAFLEITKSCATVTAEYLYGYMIVGCEKKVCVDDKNELLDCKNISSWVY